MIIFRLINPDTRARTNFFSKCTGIAIIPLHGEQWTKEELHFPPDTKPHMMANRLSRGQIDLSLSFKYEKSLLNFKMEGDAGLLQVLYLLLQGLPLRRNYFLFIPNSLRPWIWLRTHQ